MPRSAKNKIYRVTAAVTDLLEKPAGGAKIGRRDSQVLFGEGFRIESRDRLWLYGTSIVDGYKGYVHQSALTPQISKPVYAVEQLMTPIYPAPDFKTRPVLTLSFMARVHVKSTTPQSGFLKTHLGWIYKGHLKKISELKNAKDPAAAALKFVGCPYLYGGRSAQGVDCSALIQLSLSSCGIPCPRDSDQQQARLGREIPHKSLRRGDLVFFKGHVGIMVDEKNLLNATSRTMDVRVEELAKVIKLYKEITAVRRL